MIVLGSKALHINLNNDVERFHRSDIDIVMSLDEFHAFVEKNTAYITKMVPTSATKYSLRLEKTRKQHYEIEIALKGSAQWLLDHQHTIVAGSFEDECGNVFDVANTEILYLTKKAHIHYAIHYNKNIADYTLLKSHVDADKAQEYMPYFKMRAQETKERINKTLPKLNRSNKEFFDRSKNVVGYIFEHDDIHEAIKHYERPVYEMMKRDFSSAWCEKDMFHELPHEYKIRCVQEEAYVIALERYIVLQKGPQDHFEAYKAALQRICTTLCSGFFRDFAMDNYFEVLDAYSSNYVKLFTQKLLEGKVNKLDHVPQTKYDDVVAHLKLIYNTAP